ncbi:hypothetical protein RHSIM_Rhsim04G0084300 [Rhododendron simsii]|uniref:Uncharacterized protein n=1 Tax=Rhododendron simsii TaxID=118357 RepID=A0A834H0T5_RHOSS|nr:hypothetical protein RHSIM_Rhsim04G0084300 [Rhododendron simsii]
MKAELVFIPSPGMGHLVSTVEMAKKLIGRDHRLSITVLIMKTPFDSKSKVSQSLLLAAAEDRLKFVYLQLEDEAALAELLSKNPGSLMSEFVDMNKQRVRDHVKKMLISTESTRLAGFVVDMFCAPMMDVADEFGLPTYAFFTSSCAFLGLMFHLETLNRDHKQDVTELKDSDAELEVPVFVKPVPAKVLPSMVLSKEGGSTFFMEISKRLRETKGIMVNTFEELESYAVKCLAEDDKVPPIYPVGPVLHLVKDENKEEVIQIMRWLDNQPPSSVVFLCFGSMGSFEADQVREIAQALEQSGHRFLWSVRQPPPKGKIAMPDEYQDLSEVLPEGKDFRTTDKVNLVTANEMENGIRKLMENEDKSKEGINQKVKEMSEKSKTAVEEGGSSYNYIERFIDAVLTKNSIIFGLAGCTINKPRNEGGCGGGTGVYPSPGDWPPGANGGDGQATRRPRPPSFNITVLIMKIPLDKSKVSSSTQSLLLTAAEDRLKFVYPPQEEAAVAELLSKNPRNFLSEFVNVNKQHVRDHVKKMMISTELTDSSRPVRFVVDMFCTPMMEVASEFGLPTYAFVTSGCAFLGVMFHLETLNGDHNQDVTELKDSDAELEVPIFVNPVPAKVLPYMLLSEEEGSTFFLEISKRLRETKGIMVNAFEELESYADKNKEEEEVIQIMRGLDDQPPSLVVFLCFRSLGTFEGTRELGLAVEIKLDYRKDVETAKVNLVTANEIENGIRKLMENEDKSSEGIK